MNTNVPNVPKEPYYETEFEEFLNNIGNSRLKNWSIIAESLGVSRKTITRWKAHPIAKRAIAKAINVNIRKMKEVGKNDWRMYREVLKMLGVNDKQELKHELPDERDIANVLGEMEKTDYDEFAEWAEFKLNKMQKEQNEYGNNNQV